MKINVNKWQNQWTGELSEIYISFYFHYDRGEYVQASRYAKKFMDKFIELYNSIELLRNAETIPNEYREGGLNKDVADFEETK